MTSTDSVSPEGRQQVRVGSETSATDSTPSRGGRQTRQRRLIIDHLLASPDFHTAQELYDHLRLAGAAVSLATVYRSLQQLAEAGELDTVHLADGLTAYRRCTPGSHHHHLICRRCHRGVEIDSAAIEAWAAQIGLKHGFSQISHSVELDGLCRDCEHSFGPMPTEGA